MANRSTGNRGVLNPQNIRTTINTGSIKYTRVTNNDISGLSGYTVVLRMTVYSIQAGLSFFSFGFDAASAQCLSLKNNNGAINGFRLLSKASTTGTNNRDIPNTQYPIGKPTTIALRFDGSTIQFWQDGVQRDSSALVGSFPTITGPNSFFFIGADPNGNSAHDAAYHFFRAWNRALNSTEILDAMNGYEVPTPVTNFRMTESGSPMTDYGSAGQNGVLTNATINAQDARTTASNRLAPGNNTINTDSFTRANNTVLGSTEQGKTWTTTDGAIGITSNQAVVNTLSGQGAIALFDSSIGNISTFKVDINMTTNSDAGLVFRATGNSTYLCARASTASNNIILLKRVAGTNTTLQTVSYTFNVAQTYTLMVSIINFTIMVFVNGQVLIQYEMTTSDQSSFPTTQTNVGIRTIGAGGVGTTYDNLICKYPDF